MTNFKTFALASCMALSFTAMAHPTVDDVKRMEEMLERMEASTATLQEITRTIENMTE